MGQIIMCTTCMSNYHLYDFFVEIINNEKKLEKTDKIDNDVYILHVKRYVICTCSEFGR
jgi:hypothetical protein